MSHFVAVGLQILMDYFFLLLLFKRLVLIKVLDNFTVINIVFQNVDKVFNKFYSTPGSQKMHL